MSSCLLRAAKEVVCSNVGEGSACFGECGMT